MACVGNLVSILQVENVLPGKRKKNVEYLRHRSRDFHHIFTEMIANRTVAGHLILVTDDLENVGQRGNLEKLLFMMRKYF